MLFTCVISVTHAAFSCFVGATRCKTTWPGYFWEDCWELQLRKFSVAWMYSPQSVLLWNFSIQPFPDNFSAKLSNLSLFQTFPRLPFFSFWIWKARFVQRRLAHRACTIMSQSLMYFCVCNQNAKYTNVIRPIWYILYVGVYLWGQKCYRKQKPISWFWVWDA